MIVSRPGALSSLADRPPRSGADVGAAALRRMASALGIDLSPGQTDSLLHFVELLQRWNGTYNLTSVRDADAMLVQHVADCLAAWPSIRQHAARPTRTVLDVGSGAGLPGVVIAVMEPRWQVTCIDSVGKKAAFVRQAAAELGLSNLAAAHARVEAMTPEPGGYDLVTSRAFAPLSVFVGLTRRVIAPDGRWLAMKGRQPDAEIASLPGFAEVFHVEPIAVPSMEAERCLVWMAPTQHYVESER